MMLATSKERYDHRKKRLSKIDESFYENWERTQLDLEASDEWKIDNLEYDLRSSEYIHEKCKDEFYAQNLYAAMCNREFVKNDVWPILTDNRWSCSWRHAGGIIADIQQEGDYIDWYCSGIRGELTEQDLITAQTTKGITSHTGKMKDRITGEVYYEQTTPQGTRLVGPTGKVFSGDTRNLMPYGIGSDVQTKNEIQMNQLKRCIVL